MFWLVFSLVFSLFRNLHEHTYLAVALARWPWRSTVFIISAAYSRIIEQFPPGGGGYVVATKLLGQRGRRRLRLARCSSTTC